jgi:hypothetical protein
MVLFIGVDVMSVSMLRISARIAYTPQIMTTVQRRHEMIQATVI